MQNNSTAFQDAVARAKQIAQKLSAAAPNSSGIKRPNSDDDSSGKRPVLSSSTTEVASPVLRAQLVAQQINSQLGVKGTGDAQPLSNLLTSQEDYRIPDKFVGLIIGKGGEQITRIQAESGCKVQISQLRQDSASGGGNAPDRVANLSGTREAIERAKKIMDDIISRGRMAEGGVNPYSMSGSSNKSIEVMLPSAKCGLIIGKGGENIRRIMDEYNVKLFVGQETIDIDGIEHKPLKITGDPDKAELARKHVLDQLSRPGPNSAAARAAAAAAANQSGSSSYGDYGSRTDGAPGAGPCNEAVYHVPYDKAGIIIGKGGETIKEINRRSGAFVELDKNYLSPPGTPPERVFKLRGTPEQIVTAQQLMYERVANSACGASDLLTPILFQTQFNLPLLGNTPMDGGWNASSSTDPSATDPYSQWAAAYAQWPQAANGANSADPSAMMDPAWLAYYQSMNYYSMMQSSLTSATATTTTTSKPTDSTADSTASTATSAATAAGQADYTQQWIEYYRSIGQNDVADQIAQQMKDGSASAWAAYAQQWSNGGAAAAAAAATGSTSAATNGSSTSSTTANTNSSSSS